MTAPPRSFFAGAGFSCPGTITPVPAKDVLAGHRRGALVPLLERKREILAGQAKERQATSTGGNAPQLVGNLPQAGDKTRDAVAAAEIGARARVDHPNATRMSYLMLALDLARARVDRPAARGPRGPRGGRGDRPRARPRGPVAAGGRGGAGGG